MQSRQNILTLITTAWEGFLISLHESLAKEIIPSISGIFMIEKFVRKNVFDF